MTRNTGNTGPNPGDTNTSATPQTALVEVFGSPTGTNPVPRWNAATQRFEWIDTSATYVPAFILAGTGIDPTNATDSYAALQARINAAPSGTRCVLPPGTYSTTATITLRADCSYDFTGATIAASAVIAGPVIDTPGATAMVNQQIVGGIINANNKAANGLWLRLVNHSGLKRIVVQNTTSHAIIVGDDGAAGSSYELIADDVEVIRDSTGAVPTGSIGFWLRRATDCEITNLIVVGSDIGVQIEADGPNTRITHAHVWGYPGHLPTVGYKLLVGADLVGCCADSCTVVGFWFNNCSDASLVSSRVITHPTQVDNTAIGAQVDSGCGRVFSVANTFTGQSGSVRLARDWLDSGPLTYIIGQATIYSVVLQRPFQIPQGVAKGIPYQDKIFFTTPGTFPPGIITVAAATQFTSMYMLAAAGSGATYHLEKGGVSLTPVTALGSLATVNFTLTAGQSAYVVMDNVGAGVSGVTVVAGGFTT